MTKVVSGETTSPLCYFHQESRLLPCQEEVVVMEGPQLCQSAQQAAEPLRAPPRGSAWGPAHPGQQVEDHFLQLLHAVRRLQGCSVCRAEAQMGLGVRPKREAAVQSKLLAGCET